MANRLQQILEQINNSGLLKNVESSGRIQPFTTPGVPSDIEALNQTIRGRNPSMGDMSYTSPNYIPPSDIVDNQEFPYLPQVFTDERGAKLISYGSDKPVGTEKPTIDLNNIEVKNAVQPQGLLGEMSDALGSFSEGLSDFFNPDGEVNWGLVAGLNSMRYKPDSGIATIAAQGMKEQSSQKGRNLTADQLERMGYKEYAQAVRNGSMKGSTAWTLVNKQDKETDTIQNIKWRAKEAGLTEGSKDYKDFVLNYGRAGGFEIVTNPDGTFSIKQGTTGGKGSQMTQSMGQATGFFKRVQTANKILTDLDTQGTLWTNWLLGEIPAANFMLSNDGRRYLQAKNNFINAVLRQESGAAIADTEYTRADVQYFPQPGDDEATIRQKAQNRKDVQDALEIQASGKPLSEDQQRILDDATSLIRGSDSDNDKEKLPKITSYQEIEKLPKGSKYVDAFGNVQIKSW
jgi:hypothetical protein